MAHPVIIGAGMPLALEQRKTCGHNARITRVSAVDHFQFVPSNPWGALGWRKRPRTTTVLAPPLKKRKVNPGVDTVSHIDPDEQRVEPNGGNSLDYDYVVITTRPKSALDEMPGLPSGALTGTDSAFSDRQ